LKLIVTEDGLSSNAPHVRDLIDYGRAHRGLGHQQQAAADEAKAAELERN
jgi:hypothetical protein